VRALVLAVAAMTGCTQVGVRPADPAEAHDSLAGTVRRDRLSPSSLQSLRQRDLEEAYQRDPAGVFARLQELAEQEPAVAVLFTLAEISYLQGRALEHRDAARATGFYYLCAGYAYHYLFDEQRPGDGSPPVVSALTVDPAPDPASLPARAFDPCFRQACDLYNAGLAACLRTGQDPERLDPRRAIVGSLPGGQRLDLAAAPSGAGWRPEDLGPLFFAADYAPVGIANPHRNYGLGVPLIGMRRDAVTTPGSAHYPHGLTFPVTALLLFEGSPAELRTRPTARLELYNPLATPTVDVAGRATPLEADLTTPLAFFLAQTDLADLTYTGFVRADIMQKQAGLYLLEPYQPGKIPVVLVHGLISSPLAWAQVMNDLRADPAVRDHFQFWFYAYPTGNPVLLTAADLRQALNQTREELDPRGRDPALSQMVIISHSMGGLVARLLVADSGEIFWRLVSARRFAQLPLSPEAAAELHRLFFFEHSPLVHRVVFLGTPFHGTHLATSVPAKLAIPFIRQPPALVAATEELARLNGEARPALPGGKLENGLDLLTPGNALVETIASLHRPPDVRFHAIVGIVPFTSAVIDRVFSHDFSSDGSDGVVTYRSAHQGDVDSELVVPADHRGVKQHPRAMRELRRILLEHLRSVHGGDSQSPDHEEAAAVSRSRL
jgi:hypothetical protein